MPQPIDLQSELSRVVAAERIQQLAARNAQAVQQRSLQQQHQQEVAAESKVQETTEAQHGQVDPDGDANKGRKEKKKKPPTPEDIKAHTIYTADEKPEVIESPEEHKLDISV